jgi:hypothetical protein
MVGVMSINDERFDPKDTEKSRERINDGTAPCNIYGTVKEILKKQEELEARIQALEEK